MQHIGVLKEVEPVRVAARPCSVANGSSRPPELSNCAGSGGRGPRSNIWEMRLRTWGVVVVALTAFVSVVVLGAHRAVSSRVEKEAAARQVELRYESLSLRPFTTVMRGVTVRPIGMQSGSVRFNEVKVSLTSRLKVDTVSITGGTLELNGAPEQIKRELTAWKQSLPHATNTENTTPSDKHIALRDLKIRWHADDGSTLNADQVSADKIATGYLIRAKHAEGNAGDFALNVADLDVEVAPNGTPHAIHASAITVNSNAGDERVSVPRVIEPRGNEPRAEVSLVPPPLPLPAETTRTKKTERTVTRAVERVQEPFDVRLYKAPDLQRVHTLLRSLATRIESKVPVDSSIDVKLFRIDAEVHGQHVIFGGPLVATRDQDRFRIEFTSERAQDGAALKASLVLPLTGGETRFQFAGGPLPLSLLGVEKGSLGVTNPATATLGGEGFVSLDSEATHLAFDVRAAIGDLAVLQPRIAKEALERVNASVAARGSLSSTGKLSLENAELRLGRLSATFRGTVDPQRSPLVPTAKSALHLAKAEAKRDSGKTAAPTTAEGDHVAVALEGEIVPSGCEDIKESLPPALLPHLARARFAGSFGATLRIRFDTRKLDDLFLDYKVDNRCTMVDAPFELSRDRFRRPFSHLVYSSTGELHEERSGPGSDFWTALDDISPHMQAAVLTTEDGSFFKHHGFNHNTVKSSVIANLKAGRFVRGASTISMQLTKNLFLSRDKTMSRKLEEVLLTDYVESTFSKEEMMELYLNIIEFGPDLYGITKAADHYYGRRPDELNIAECMFLSSVLPSPIRFHGLYQQGPRVPDHWMSYLKTLISIAERNGRVTSGEVAEALAGPVMFHKPNQPRPEPRSRVVRDPLGDDSDATMFDNLD